MVNETYFRIFIGYLMYLTTTRPDYVLRVLSRFICFPSEVHPQPAKRVV